ncbi:hypothetical protein BAE44_0024969 [Dichanthelium oligosanthes]|uniref:Uncharacterized protein n=1 Tax=Dichanthelium oligosanthes TaxID=888268 RepID=A0A1E5UMC9_9POAL|nr:hypothetical protein BAE44_0024969 [Dichanthelium oligosanthes]
MVRTWHHLNTGENDHPRVIVGMLTNNAVDCYYYGDKSLTVSQLSTDCFTCGDNGGGTAASLSARRLRLELRVRLLQLGRVPDFQSR